MLNTRALKPSGPPSGKGLTLSQKQPQKRPPKWPWCLPVISETPGDDRRAPRDREQPRPALGALTWCQTPAPRRAALTWPPPPRRAESASASAAPAEPGSARPRGRLRRQDAHLQRNHRLFSRYRPLFVVRGDGSGGREAASLVLARLRAPFLKYVPSCPALPLTGCPTAPR